MNKALICLAGLAAMLSQTPAVLANPNPTNWNAAVNQTAPDRQSGLQFNPAVSAAPASSTREFQPDQLKIPAHAVDVHVGAADQKPVELPPPPPLPSPSSAAPLPPPPSFGNAHEPPSAPSAPSPTQFATPIPTDLGVDFGLTQPAPPQPYQPLTPHPVQPPSLPSLSSSPSPPLPSTKQPAEFTLSDLFTGDSDSLVAVTVGNAEGTRTPDGKSTDGFYGHSDPGNGVWNLGTFSYQHGAASPQEADAKQLKRLKKQAQVIQEKAAARGMKLTLEETLNAIDLANQAPKAVLDTDGYIEWLAEAHRMGKQGADAILWARVQSFFDPQTQRWNAPGLGNTPERITRDQQRRMLAITRALEAQDYQIAADARLRPQPVSFRLPKWNFASRVVDQIATLFNFLGG